MSLANAFGQPPPLPVNETIAGSLSINGNNFLQQNGVLLSQTATTELTVYSYTLPTFPLNNGALYAKFRTLAKGGALGNTNNATAQETLSVFVTTNNVVQSFLYFQNWNHSIGFVSPNGGQNISITGSTINFQVQNTTAGQTTDYLWEVELHALIGPL